MGVHVSVRNGESSRLKVNNINDNNDNSFL